MRACLLLLTLTGCSTDAFEATDGGGDAGGGGADCGAAATFCSKQPQSTVFYCSDFDESTTTITGWSVDVQGTASVAPSNADFTSCPNSALFDLQQQGAVSLGSQAHAWLHATAPSSSASIVLAFDVTLPTLGSGVSVDDVTFLRLSKDQDTSWHVALEHSSDGGWFVRVHQGTGVSTTPSNGLNNPLLGSWNHMTLTVLFAGDSTGTVDLTYASTTSSNATINTIVGPNMRAADAPGSQVTLDMGVEAESATDQDYKATFDSITLATK
jgi:hypothetical protein